MNLFGVIPAESDATSFYRALQPIAQLRKIMPSLNISLAGREVTVGNLAHMDVMFLQRPSNPEHVALIDLCKQLGVKVWTDYDDNLFCVPESNPAHSLYGSEETQKRLREILSKSDVISVSTNALAVCLKKEAPEKKIHVIPNAFNDYILKEKPKYDPQRLLLWRGTQSHQQDLLMFAKQIIETSVTYPEWLFGFLGYHPIFITAELKKRATYAPPIDILKYHDLIRMIRPAIAFVTLTDSTFNYCKSNIAWIEATYAGAVTLAPMWEEWARPGVFYYSDGEMFKQQLNDLLENQNHHRHAHKLSWEYIQDCRRLSKINEQRRELLLELMG